MNYITYKNIDGTITSGFKVKDVQFVNHNNRTAARSYIDLCNKLSKTFRDKLIRLYMKIQQRAKEPYLRMCYEHK